MSLFFFGGGGRAAPYLASENLLSTVHCLSFQWMQAAAPDGAPHLSAFANTLFQVQKKTRNQSTNRRPSPNAHDPVLSHRKVKTHLGNWRACERLATYTGKETAFPRRVFQPLNVIFQQLEPPRRTSRGCRSPLHGQVFGIICDTRLVRVSKGEMKEI